MAFLSIKNISFSYNKIPVVQNFSLEVEKGSFTTLLGASGSGKTTLLRLISGFLNPESGTISMDEKIMNGVLPNKRKIGLVFQDYALFPHMTVEQNLSYGLKISKDEKYSKEQIKTLVYKTAENLGISEFLTRFPSELSGGQQQRVALGRVIILKPDLLLMDEPLSSLDTKLRIKVREELKDIQKRLGITTIYVTHDQEEALSLSDKIAVLNKGTLVQYGTPSEVYFSPADRFVAELTGRSNFITFLENGTSQEYLIRPEWISLKESDFSASVYKGKIISREFLGSITRYKIHTESTDSLPSQIIFADQMAISSQIFNEGNSIKIVFERKEKIK